MKVFYFSESIHGATQLNDKLEKASTEASFEVIHFPLAELIQFENQEENKVLILDLSPLDDALFPMVINPLKILQKSGCLIKTKTYVILGKRPSLATEANLATCPLIQGMFVVGGDEEHFYGFLTNYLAGNPIPNDYATLQGMSVEVPMLFPFSLRKFDKEQAIIATHHQIPFDKTEVQNSIFDYLKLKEVTLRDANKRSESFQYKFSMPLQQHKGALKKGEMSKDAFEEHINRYSDHFLQKQNDVLIIGEGDYFKRLSSILDFECNSHIHHFDNYDELPKKVAELKPELIFLNLQGKSEQNDISKDSENSENTESENDTPKESNLSKLQSLFAQIKDISFYDPIVLIFSSPSDSFSFQEYFDYKKVLALQEMPTRNFILSLIEKFKTSTQLELSLAQFVYPRADHPYAAGWMISNVFLHEFNEGEIKFSYQEEILIGTWLKLEFPFPLSLFVYEECPSNQGAEYRCYKARIMGLFGSDENRLRVFINLSYQEPQEFFEYYLKHPTFLKEHLDKHLEGLGIPNEEEINEKKQLEEEYLKEKERLASEKVEQEKKKAAEKESEELKVQSATVGEVTDQPDGGDSPKNGEDHSP